MKRNKIIGIIVVAVLLIGVGVFIGLNRNTPASDSQTSTTPSGTNDQIATKDFAGNDACPLLQSSITKVYPTQVVVEQSLYKRALVFQGGRYWDSACQFDDSVDPAKFSANVSIKTFATESEAKDQLASDSSNRSQTASSTSAESSYSDGAFTVTTDTYGVQTKQINYVSGTSRIALVVGGEGDQIAKIEDLADAVAAGLL